MSKHNQSNRGRPVRVKYKNEKGAEFEGKAVFQVWGYQIKKDNVTNALLMNSKAIVEMPNGRCRWVNPMNIQFTDTEATT